MTVKILAMDARWQDPSGSHLTANTGKHGLIDARELALIRPSAFLINVSRGKHVVMEALVEALRAGQIVGAGLVVTHPEPLTIVGYPC